MIEPVKKTTTAYYVDDDRIITEQASGKYDITDWHTLDRDRLIRLHAVLGYLLTELAAKEHVEIG